MSIADAPTGQSVPSLDLPALNSVYPVSTQQSASYRKEGFVLLNGVATPEEVEAFRPILRDVTMRNNTNTQPLAERGTYARAFIQVSNLWQEDLSAKRFTLAKRFAQVAADLMGVDGVRIYHDQALYKEPGGGHTPWHQDQQYWPLDGVKTVTMWMPLVDADESMGTLRFAAGSQELGYLGPEPISDNSEIRWKELVKEKGFPVVAVGAMKAGDATFHSGWTLHGAPGNSSETVTREVMTIIYFEDGARVSEPDNSNRVSDLKWLGGRKPGEIAASELNPLVYSRKD